VTNQDPETHKITDCISFYSLPSTVIGHAKYPTLHAAYTFYYATDKAFPPADASAESSSSATTDIVRTRDQRDAIAERLKLLVEDLLSVAKKADFDVMNSLTTLDSNMFLQHHKFGMGNGFLSAWLSFRHPSLL
jgi:glycylpeptide N-tetradecanoyltransferase